VEEEAEIQTKGIKNLVNEITEYFPCLGKGMDIDIQEAFRTPNR
jgi:hypothetical protein